jgi:parallel beta-helix repeat protein
MEARRFFRLTLVLALLALSGGAGNVLASPGDALAATAAPDTIVLQVNASNGTVYYVSSSDGDDGYDGLSADYPFATIAKVNALALQPGDSVLFKCGDVWRAEQLVISQSGAEGNPITFGSYPEGCANQPVISGAQPITGWTLSAGHIYVADLSAGDNVGKFPLGINQLFRDGERLPFGRWPNIDANSNGGYSTVDGQPSSNQMTDNELPAGNWIGAVIRIKTQRWLLINREVTGSVGQTLTLNEAVDCRGGTCEGWGYFIHNHLSTLDQESEWYYDAGTNSVYLYSASAPPSNIEGSVILDEDTRFFGGIMLGSTSPIAYLVVENLEITDWFNHGIGAPGSMRGDIYHHLTIRNNTIKDVDAAGVKLNTWIWSADNGRDGLRGGHHMEFANNVIEGANHFGLTGYFYASTIQDNEIKNIGLIANLGKSGMGCGTTGASCTENGDGIRIRRYIVQDSGHSNTVRHNRIERTGYNGMDVFGPDNTIEYNFIRQPCYSKGDCGGVRTFGNDSLAATQVYNLAIRNNVIVDSIGNVDGIKEDYKQLFGMGLYIDNYSKDVEVTGNTVISATITGILYQRSTGQIRNNTVYNAASSTMYCGQIGLAGSQTQVTALYDNVLYGLTDNAWTLSLSDGASLLASDNNYFFHPYVDKQITTGGWSGRKTFEEWQVYSGMDGYSKKNWFTLNGGDPPLSKIFYNATATPVTVDLGDRQYLDLDQNAVLGSLTLSSFSSQVLIDNGEAPLTLLSLYPSLWGVDEAADFTLALTGAGFTPGSVVRWSGADRPTTFVSGSTLTATIYAADVSTVADVPVTVYDPSPPPTGTETSPLIFHVVESVHRVYLPLVARNLSGD